MNALLEAADGTEALPLDPFGAYPHRASRIAHLGGEEPSPDPSYVFATVDFRPAIGRVRATVRFDDLAVSYGTLLFEVLVRSAVPGAEPSRLKTVVVDAAELVAAGGVVELDFESYRNTYYAFACGINDETDIACSGIFVLLDRRATPEEHGRVWEWGTAGTAIRRRPESDAALIRRSMTDLAAPTLERPQSQVGSPLQCREPAFIAAMETLRREPTGSFDNWSLAWVLRAIARFAGGDRCRMLGYGENQAPLLSHFASRQCEVVGMGHPTENGTLLDPGEALQRLWVPDLCGEADFFAHAHFTCGDIRQAFDTFRNQFDVLWSIGANRRMTVQEYIYFVVGSLIHARPGGLALHVFNYVETPVGGRDGEEPINALTRHDIERIAALALSHHNDVARLQFLHGAVPPDAGTSLPFGLVLLRGDA